MREHRRQGGFATFALRGPQDGRGHRELTEVLFIAVQIEGWQRGVDSGYQWFQDCHILRVRGKLVEDSEDVCVAGGKERGPNALYFYRRFDVILRHHHTARRTVNTKVGRGPVAATTECANEKWLVCDTCAEIVNTSRNIGCVFSMVL
jgi:hypothetical protein